MMDKDIVNVVKIGGNVIDSPEALRGFLESFARIKGRKVLVHGGGKEASRLGKRLGIEPHMIDGRRVTDARTLEIVTMVYAGLINKRIVAMLQGMGVNALGMTGADGNAIPAARRSPMPVDYGFVGDIDPADVNAGLIGSLTDEGSVPVFCAICHDGHGTLLNCNADSVAAALAEGLARVAPVRLTYCFERPGVLADVDNPESVIPLVTPPLFERLVADGVVADGMIPKLKNALASASAGVEEVRICDAASLLGSGGTVIRDS